MNQTRQVWVLIISALLAAIAVNAIRNNRLLPPKEFADQVLNQYIRYYCPNAGVCTRKKALERLRRDWPHVYSLGFNILENDEK